MATKNLEAEAIDKVEVYDKEYQTHFLYVYERPIFKNEQVVGIEGVAKLLN